MKRPFEHDQVARGEPPSVELANTTLLRPVPWSSEAEQAVLGALLLDNNAFDRVGDLLLDSDFFAHVHQRIFRAIASMICSSKPADVMTVATWLENAAREEHGETITMAYLHAMTESVPSAFNVRRYAEIVRQRAQQRALMTAADEAMSIALEPSNVEDRTERVVALFDRLQQRNLQQRPREVASIAVRRIDHYNAMAMGEITTGWSTGLEDLDKVFNGGLQEGRVYVLAARPSVGKSALAQQIGLHHARVLNRGVLLLSQEMPAEECVDRAVSNLGCVDYGQIQRGQFDDTAWAGMSTGVEMLGKMPFWIDDQAALTLRDIRAKAYSLRREGLKLLIVDYLQLCSGQNPGKGVNRNTELEEITRGVKALAKQLGIAVLLLSQLSREVEKRSFAEPTLGDLRDSGAIEQDADAVLGLWFVRQWSDRKVMALSILKNRQGERGGRVALEFLGQHQLWLSSSADVNPISKQSGSGSFE